MLKRLLLTTLMLGMAQPVLADGVCEEPGFVEYLTKGLKSMRLEGGGTLGSYMAAGAKLTFSTIYQGERKIVCGLKFKVLWRGHYQNIRSRVTYIEIADDRATLKWEAD